MRARTPMHGRLTRTQVLFLKAAGVFVTHGSRVTGEGASIQLIDSKGRVFPVPPERLQALQVLWEQGEPIEFRVNAPEMA